MSQVPGLIKKTTLTLAERQEIEQLTDLCNRYENLHMRLDFGMLRERPDNVVTDFLYYRDGRLLGYLGLDNWGAEERELVAMVHPDFRRQGIFNTLFAATKEECSRNGLHRLELVCERSSVAGQACAKAIRARYGFAEHEMVLAEFKDSYTFDERIFFRPAARSDLDALVTVQADSFNDPELFVRAKLLQLWQDQRHRFYLATFGEGEVSCKELVGSLRLDETEQAIGIYAFGVVPDYRRRGYGRQMLEEVIRIVRAESQKPIMLDVEVDNAAAIALYTSCGFQIKTTYDYYIVEVQPT
jgi:ribosomal protein S18 acetylase RimI-like enzyme